MRRLHAAVGLMVLAGLGACSKPFDYDQASEAEREKFFEQAAQGLYDGLEHSIPHGAGGVYMQMGPRKIDIARRRIEVLVNVQNDEDEMPDFSSLSQTKLLRTVCPEYMAGDLGRNKVTVYIRFAMPGGGTAAAVTATPGTCASFASKG